MTQLVPWLAFGSVVLLLLAFDLGLLDRWRRSPAREPTVRVALAWSAIWIGLATMFGFAVVAMRGPAAGAEYFTAYLVEQALSIDNLFVMMLVFTRFGIPRSSQRRVLVWGIVGVVVLRGVMIASGTALVTQFHALTYVLGAFLIVAAIKLARELGAPHDAPHATPPGGARVRALLARVMPISDELDGERFTTFRNGVRHATPLLLALLTIELADAIFALDSVPAVFGVTTDPFIAFTSNLFAVLGLRSMYFALSGLLERLRYLKHGLVGVLGVVGTKMLVAAFWPVPTWVSLALVSLTLGGAVVASLVSASGSVTERIS